MTVPLWGWPWHGALDSLGVLHLPNGQTMWVSDYSYPERYFNYRVKVPGTPDIQRTEAELLEDYAAGREWRNEAIMSGTSLHGQRRGGWIYSAPDGSRWIVRIPSETIYEISKLVEAIRFGDLYGSPVTQGLQIDWPSDDELHYGAKLNLTSNPNANPTTEVKRERWPVDITPDGSKAIFMMYSGPDDQPEQRRGNTPLGFQLVELSGGRDGITITASTLRTLEQTLGSWRIYDNIIVEKWTNRRRYGHVGANGLDTNRKFPDPPGTVYYPDVEGEWNKGAGYELVNGQATRYIEKRILALWFNRAGEVIECTLDEVKDRYVETEEPEAIATGPESARWGMLREDHTTTTLTLRLGGDVAYEYVELHEYFFNTVDDDEWTLSRSSRDDGTSFEEKILWTDYWFPHSYSPIPGVNRQQLFMLARDNWLFVRPKIISLYRVNYYQEGVPRTISYNGLATPDGVVPRTGEVPWNTGAAVNTIPSFCFNPYSGEVSEAGVNVMCYV